MRCFYDHHHHNNECAVNAAGVGDQWLVYMELVVFVQVLEVPDLHSGVYAHTPQRERGASSIKSALPPTPQNRAATKRERAYRVSR